MEEEQAIVTCNIYNDQNYDNEYVENSNEEHHINLSANSEQERLQSRIEEEQVRNYAMAARPVVCVADKGSWEDAILTTVKRPMINYPKHVQPVEKPTSQHSLSFSMPQTMDPSEYTTNQRTPSSDVCESYVERNRKGGNLNVKASAWHPITELSEEPIMRPRRKPFESAMEPPITMVSNSGEEMIRALRQVVSTPRIKYLHFDGDPMNYVSFMHNFETCLEKDNPDGATRLQLLIQHCTGKAKEAIESCVNLPAEQGYMTAKNTLKENFGKPHIIAKAHIKKLVGLPPLKQADGPTLLEYARNLEIAHRTLSSMGPEYESELSHVNTLRELNRKLPLFMRVKWTERAGTIIESDSRPKFQDFLQFVKARARLVNNEFAEDLCAISTKSKEKGKGSGVTGRYVPKSSTLTAGMKGTQRENTDSKPMGIKCLFCSGIHRIWKCTAFMKSSYLDRRKFVQDHHLCMKCLSKGHFLRTCPKVHFRCQEKGCTKEHHTLLHPVEPAGEKNGTENKDEEVRPDPKVTERDNSQNESRLTAATGAGERVCLSVVPVKVRIKGQKNPAVVTYALLDCGSEVTLVHQNLKEELGARGREIDFLLSGINGSRQVNGELLDIVVTSMDGETSLELSNVRTVEQMPISRSCIARKEDIKSWPHLVDVPITELPVDEITLIIGLQEKPSIFLPLEYRTGGEEDPVAIRYSLGWTVVGPIGGRKDEAGYGTNFARTVNSVNTLYDDLSQPVDDGCNGSERMLDPAGLVDESASSFAVSSLDEDLNHKLERLWRTDFQDCVVDTKVCPSVEDQRALKMIEQSLQQVNGHYQVALPWRHNPPRLPNNRESTAQRALTLKKRLLRDQGLLEKYATTMNDYLGKGYAEKIPRDELQPADTPIWYLPHHPVIHPAKPDKVRIVFDCAAAYQNTSLNQQLLQGPDQTNQLVGVLIRFRQERIGLVSDIESMFHQVLVDPRDCDALRFFWWPNADLTGEMEEYRMVRHLFGATSSPSVANFCLRRTADDHRDEFDPRVLDTIKRNMYVDDMMKSVEDTCKATTLVKQSRELLAKGGFRLTKWYSNDREVLASIPEGERAKSVVNLDIEKLPTESALGLKWNTENDSFVWDVAEKLSRFLNTEPVTRRDLVSAVYSLFDPLGFIAPYLMKAKLLLQMLVRKGVGWDDPLGEDERTQWRRWLADLPKLSEIRINRCFKPAVFGNIVEIQLHLFSDASRSGYSSVAFLRLTDSDKQVYCAFVIGKSRLAPIREISIPRLELTAAVVSVRLSKIVQEEIDLKIGRIVYWTDSTSVLKCIYNEGKRFHTFESNRLTVIHNGSETTEWRYVNREDNPADDGSKGLKLDDLLKDDRWLKGPEFLWKDEEHWPKLKDTPTMKDNDPEVRKEARVYSMAQAVHPLESLTSYFSSWWNLKRAVAWLLRFKGYLRMKSRNRKDDSTKEQIQETKQISTRKLTVEELDKAEREVLQRVQALEFADELKTVSLQSQRESKKLLKSKGSALNKLNPILKEGLLKVGGRLSNASVDDKSKHPVILPSRHPVTDMIIRQHHAEVGHMGQESVLSSIRKEYWVVKGRAAVKRVIRSCVMCQRRKARLGEQFMASLPQTRLTPDKPPFTFVGIDYFGPFLVKQRRCTVKRYGCIFTCFTTRAVHIEISHSLDTDSMLNALRRFISIRGCPEQIKSDRGTNFVSANKELKECMERWNEEQINTFCLQRKIKWTFNPPSASHKGGVWERMIRSVRQILRTVLKEQLVSDETLLTVMAETMNILNSRPLTRNSDSVSDLEPLTPNHLLHLRPSPSLPPGVFEKDDLYCKRAWRQAQYLANVFWRRWTKEYLPTLMERQKWNSPKGNLKVGDIVLLADEGYPRGQWPLAIVVEAEASEDGYVRTVKVRSSCTVATRARRLRTGKQESSTTILTRPVTKLCLLEMDGEGIQESTTSLDD